MNVDKSNGWHRRAKASANKRASRIGLGRYSHKRRKRYNKPAVIYSVYMKSREWFAKRDLFFVDPNLPKVCLACGCEDVVLHHVTYDRLGYELLTDLAPLCVACHDKVHRCDPTAGKRGGIWALRKSLIYDFGISTLEVNQ